MFSKFIWICCICFILINECHSSSKRSSQRFSQRISKITVNGKRMKVCEYKLMKMLPKSTFSDTEACLKCSCSQRALTCNVVSTIPGCKPLAGGLMTQNPFEKEWTNMVDGLIQQKYISNYRILQVKTQVVAGTNTDIWLLVKDRLCDLTIFENFKGKQEITTDSCDLGLN